MTNEERRMMSVLLKQIGGLVELAQKSGSVGQVRDLMRTVEAMADAVCHLLGDKDKKKKRTH